MANFAAKTRHKREPALRAAKDRAKALGIKLEVLAYINVGTTASNIVDIADSKAADLTIISPIATPDLIYNNNILLKNLLAVNTMNRDIGLFINKDTIELQLTHVLCPLFGSDCDKKIVKYAQMMGNTPSIEITLYRFTSENTNPGEIEIHNQFTDIATAHSSLKYITSTNPNIVQAILSELTNKNKYQLVMLGPLPRAEYAIFEEQCPVSILTIYTNYKDSGNRLLTSPSENNLKYTPLIDNNV